MKLPKRLIVITVIAAFAIIANNFSSDNSCGCQAEAPFPFSIFSKMFNNNRYTIAGDNHDHGTNGMASIFGGVALAQKKSANIKVTFIELGSVNCIPCRMMQPVMKQIEEKYGSQVKVVFHDVWTEKGAPFARVYRIRAIPTQVYFDSDDKEFFRHEGFHPFEEVEKVLKQRGVR